MTSDLKELVKSSFGHFKMDKITNTYSDLKSEILFRIKTNKMTLV